MDKLLHTTQWLARYCTSQPMRLAAQAVLTLVALASLFTTPFLTLLGFSAAGPVASCLAASYQSVYGATAVFSTLQSAAMGGYGVPMVAGPAGTVFRLVERAAVARRSVLFDAQALV